MPGPGEWTEKMNYGSTRDTGQVILPLWRPPKAEEVEEKPPVDQPSDCNGNGGYWF